MSVQNQNDASRPKGEITFKGTSAYLYLSGILTSEFGSVAEKETQDLYHHLKKIDKEQINHLIIDLQHVVRIDTLGAWLVSKLSQHIEKLGIKVETLCTSEIQKILLREAAYQDFSEKKDVYPHGISYYSHLAVYTLGKNSCEIAQDFVRGIAFLGEITTNLFQGAAQRRGLRFPSIVNQVHAIAWKGMPIVILISLVVGGIIAQQGIFQLKYFGATEFTVDLIGILSLRELALLLTAIMIAARSGSAFTAELGSMKMNEEIDALKVMGMSPMKVLILPRLIGLVFSLPLLTFIGDMSSIFGGGLVCWIYGGINPDVFLVRLQASIGLNTFLVGIIKAPFMAFVIGIIATMEGMAVQGSSESLGTHVTQSVVKSIFMVIVMDGLFAIFFAAIEY